MEKDSILEEINEMRFTSAGVKELLSAFYTNWDRIGKAVKKELYFGDFKELMNFLKGGDQEEQDELRDWIQDKGIQVMAFESLVNEASAYKLKASEFGQNTMSAPYAVKGENGTWRVHSTYAIDQVSGNNNTEERDVVFFEVFPYSNNIVIKIGGIHNIGKTNASTYGTNFATTVEEFKEDPTGIAKEASDFLTDANHLKWLNKNAKSEGQKIKWALKDDYSPVIEDLVNRALGLKESVNEDSNFDYHIDAIKKSEDYLALNGMESVGEIKRLVGGYLSDREIRPDDEKLITSLEFFKNRLGEKPNPKSTKLGKYLLKNKLAESVNEEASPYELSAEAFTAELEKASFMSPNIEVVVGPSRWARPGELRFRDHVTLRTVGNLMELYIIPLGGNNDYELYTDKSYKTGREIKVGDAKTIIKAMKRYVNKMNESLDEGMSKSAIKKAIKVIDRQIDTETGGDGEPLDNETLQALEQERERLLAMNESVNEASEDAYALHRLANNVGQETAEEFLSNHNVDLELLAKAVQQKVINKYEIRDIVQGKAGASKVKNFIKDFVNESVNEARVKGQPSLPRKILKHKDIPTWAEWVAQHSDGEWTWYESYPNVVNFKDGGGAWNQELSDGMQIYTGVKTDPKDWKEGPYRVRYDGDIVMESVNEGKKQPTDTTIKPHMSQYSVSDDPFDVAKKIGKEYGWSEKQIEKAEILIRKKYIKESSKNVKTLESFLNEEIHKTIAIEDSILQGIAEYLETTKGKLFKVINYDKRAAKDLSDLAKHLKPILDNWDEYGKVEEKLTQTFGDYLKDLDTRFEDGHKAAMGDNGGEQLENRQTALHNLRLFGNYIKSLLKEYGKDKTKLTFMKESHVKALESFLNEELPTHEIDPNAFQNPYKSDKNFFKRGYKDDEVMDDVVKTKPVKIQASQLKPSQDAVYLGKALGMAIGGVEGGNLEAVISQDNRILDGHHRWAATIFNNPKARVGGVQAELKIGDLVPVLRQAGDALGNKRGLPPKGGDQNIFKATLDDVKDAIYDGKYMNPQFYNKDKAIAWFEEQGEKKIQSALNLLQRVGPPGGAPPRADMPKIEPEQVQQIAKKLQGGAIDVRAPYVKEELNHLTSLESFIDEKKPGPDPYMTDLSKDDEEDKEEQMKKQAAMDDDDPNAYKDMPGDKEAREKGDMKKSKHTSAYHKKFKKVKSLEEFANDWAVIKEGYNVDAVAQNVVVALDSAAQFFPRYKPAEAEAEVKDVLKKYKKLQGKNAEKAAKEIRNSLEDKGLLANDILQLDVEIIIMDNLNESVNEGKYYPSTQIGSVTNKKDMHIFYNDPFIQKMYKQNRISTQELDTSYKDEWLIFIDKKDKEVITFLKKNYPGHLQIDSYLAKQLPESVVNEEKDQTNDKSKIDGEGIETGLKKKADETGVPIGILRVIMRRGMAAWKSGHRPGTNSTQWGYARVNSFLTKGDGTWGKADKDMAKEVRDGGHDKKL